MNLNKNYIQQLEELLGEFANAPLVLDDDRLKYVEIQVPRTLLQEARALLGATKGEND